MSHTRNMKALADLARLARMSATTERITAAHCRACDGFGRLPGQPAHNCAYCGGKGTIAEAAGATP